MNRSFIYFFALAIGLHAVLLFGINVPGPKHVPKEPEPPHVDVELLEPEPEVIEAPPAPPPPKPPEIIPLKEEPPPKIEAAKEEPPPQPVTPEPPPEPIKALTVQEPVAEAEKAEFKVAAAENVITEAPKEIPLSAPQPVVVPANIVVKAQPNYLHNPQPDYPLQARRRRQEGLVVLTVLLDRTGQPTRVELKESSGYTVLDEAAAEAVRGWRFEPASLDGQPVASEVEVPVRFTLKR